MNNHSSNNIKFSYDFISVFIVIVLLVCALDICVQNQEIQYRYRPLQCHYTIRSHGKMQFRTLRWYNVSHHPLHCVCSRNSNSCNISCKIRTWPRRGVYCHYIPGYYSGECDWFIYCRVVRCSASDPRRRVPNLNKNTLIVGAIT